MYCVIRHNRDKSKVSLIEIPSYSCNIHWSFTFNHDTPGSNPWVCEVKLYDSITHITYTIDGDIIGSSDDKDEMIALSAIEAL